MKPRYPTFDEVVRSSTVFLAGDRVVTPLGPGRVAYVRMAAPDYTQVQAVAVVLDSEQTNPTYTGTIFAATDVVPEARA